MRKMKNYTLRSYISWLPSVVSSPRLVDIEKWVRENCWARKDTFEN